MADHFRNSIPFDPVIADEILDAISTGHEGLKKLCAKNKHWPCQTDIYRWANQVETFGEQYTRAKARQVEWLVEDALAIAHNSDHDTMKDAKGNERFNHEWAARSRIKIDTIKWIACKLAPKLYGDKLHIEKVDLSADPDILRAKQNAQALMELKNDRKPKRSKK